MSDLGVDNTSERLEQICCDSQLIPVEQSEFRHSASWELGMLWDLAATRDRHPNGYEAILTCE